MKQPALGNTILTLRNQKGMTQKELADACNMDIRTIQRIEAGEVTPRMHSIRLLSDALGCDPGTFTSAPAAIDKANDPGDITHQLRLPFFAGIVFTLNAIAVVFDLTTHAFNTYFHVCTLIVHTGSCIFFFKGFYFIGRQHNNPVMAISSLLGMVLLPLVNIMYLFNPYYLAANYMLFILLCINEIVGGIGFLTEGYKRKVHQKVNLYMIAGCMIIIQTVVVLGSAPAFIATGLIISLLSNVVTTGILYMEYTGRGKMGALFQASEA